MVNLDLRVKIFADVAGWPDILNSKGVLGYTTNPSLMKKVDVFDYPRHARNILTQARGLPVSFEVIADESDEMIQQARIISSWSENIYVKIPVTDTKGRFMKDVIKTLSGEGIKLNVTALMTLQQVINVADVLDPDTQAIISVFAGRIADTGRDPENIMRQAANYLLTSRFYLLWASCREVWNIFQADRCGCDIITVPPEILDKLPLIGKDLDEYSRETVEQFHLDAKGLSL
jgi:transaldolase